MKNWLFSLMLLAAPLSGWAQDEQAADSTTAAPTHVMFEGVEMKGDIYDFTKALEHAGFSLTKRKGDSNYYIFKGNVCGNNCYFKVAYSKTTRTVYSITAEPKRVETTAFVDSLCQRYGEPFDTDNSKYQWQLPTGGVLLKVTDGADPILVVMDAEGVIAFKEENHR